RFQGGKPHISNKAGWLADNIFARPATLLAPSEVQRALSSRNAHVHQATLFLYAGYQRFGSFCGIAILFIAAHMRQQPFFHADEIHMWILKPLRSMQRR